MTKWKFAEPECNRWPDSDSYTALQCKQYPRCHLGERFVKRERTHSGCSAWPRGHCSLTKRSQPEIKSQHSHLQLHMSCLPEKVTLAFLSCPVRPYISNPRRGFKCQRYSHGSQFCRGKLACVKCSEREHNSENCANTFTKCPNCSRGPHAAYSCSCVTFKKERDNPAKSSRKHIFPRSTCWVRQRTGHNSAREVCRLVWVPPTQNFTFNFLLIRSGYATSTMER